MEIEYAIVFLYFLQFIEANVFETIVCLFWHPLNPLTLNIFLLC